MRAVKEIKVNIPDVKVFSKLDAESGFLQMKLDEALLFLTTLNITSGRNC